MLIVIEGIDGSGKSTQLALLKSRLTADGFVYHALDFPRYGRPGGQLAKLYLQGAFGKKPGDVNPYAASSFFSVDRISSYLEDWRGIYEQGTLIVSDRYTTSNATHHGSKFPPERREAFFSWLFTFEYELLGLPKPDLTILLDIPSDAVQELLSGRGEGKDIHERDTDYLRLCRESALQAAALYGWRRVGCIGGDGRLRSENDIHEEIYRYIREIIC
ncbi:MAG: thymidylate kinase [Oscillospiraceae bacterium]|nr:thymidylate kinase [Oscillospiraceae bacterium]